MIRYVLVGLSVINLNTFYIIIQQEYYMATITSIASGDWTAVGTWDSGTIPTSADTVIIAHSVWLIGSTPIVAECLSLKFSTNAVATLVVAGGSHTLNGDIDFRLTSGSYGKATKYIFVDSNNFGFQGDTTFTINGNIYSRNVYGSAQNNYVEIECNTATTTSTPPPYLCKVIVNGDVICTSIQNQSSTVYGGYVFLLVNHSKLEINGNYIAESDIYDVPSALLRNTISSAVEPATSEITINGDLIGGGRYQAATSSVPPSGSIMTISKCHAIITITGRIIPTRLKMRPTSLLLGSVFCVQANMTVNFPNGLFIPFVREIPLIASRNNTVYNGITVGDYKLTINIGSPGIVFQEEIPYSGAHAIYADGIMEIVCDGDIDGGLPLHYGIYCATPRTVPSTIVVNGDIIPSDYMRTSSIYLASTAFTNPISLTVNGNVYGHKAGLGSISIGSGVNLVQINGDIRQAQDSDSPFSCTQGAAITTTATINQINIDGVVYPSPLYGSIDSSSAITSLANSGTIDRVVGSDIPNIPDRHPFATSLAIGMRITAFSGTVNNVQYGLSNYNPIGCDFIMSPTGTITMYGEDGTPIVLTSAGDLPDKEYIKLGVLDGKLNKPDTKYILESEPFGTGDIGSPCPSLPQLEISE